MVQRIVFAIRTCVSFHVPSLIHNIDLFSKPLFVNYMFINYTLNKNQIIDYKFLLVLIKNR